MFRCGGERPLDRTANAFEEYPHSLFAKAYLLGTQFLTGPRLIAEAAAQSGWIKGSHRWDIVAEYLAARIQHRSPRLLEYKFIASIMNEVALEASTGQSALTELWEREADKQEN